MNTQAIKNTLKNTIKLATVCGFLYCSVVASAASGVSSGEYVATDNFSTIDEISMGKSYRKLWDPDTKRIDRYYPRRPFELTPRKVPGTKPRRWWK